MSDFVTIYEARDRLAELVDRAAAGEDIVITRNGVPLALLGPLPSRARAADATDLKVASTERGRAEDQA